MRAFSSKRLVAALLSLGVVETLAQVYTTPTGSPGFYHGNSSASVTFDKYSIFLENERTLFLSGEFHPYRLPSPALWKDVLQKFKSSGLNGVSVYWHWALVSPRQGVNIFKDHNDIAKFLQVAQEVGLLVIVRPGPYINAESAGGGFPGWLTNIPALARTNATLYHDAWYPYIKEFAQLSAPFQYPNGPLIGVQAENEFGSSEYYKIPGLNEYMQEVIEALREGGLNKVPTTHNDNWPKGAFAGPGLGQVDFYGWDSYPNGFDCGTPDVWSELDPSFYSTHLRLAPAVPLALYELQGGSFDAWMGHGYDACYKLTNERFANVFYKNFFAQGAKMHNLYMTYGGTNWGDLGTDTVYSSYDYGAPIREDRTLTPKLAEMKTHNYFLHATPAFMTADRVGDGSKATGTAFSDSNDIYTTVWHDSTSGTNLYFVRQTTNTKTSTTEFTLRVNSTVLGTNAVVPSSGVMTLDGRESKILVTDYKFGTGKKTLIFSTAEVLTWETFDGDDYIYLYTLPSNAVEIILAPQTRTNVTAPAGFNVNTTSTFTKITAAANRSSPINVIKVGTTTVILADKSVAYQTWAPRILSTAVGVGHYTPAPKVPGVWIVGPYFVRSATMQSGGTLALEGDLNADTTIEIWGPTTIKRVTWNNHSVQITKNQQLFSKTGKISFGLNAESIKVPDLSTIAWKSMDSMPELALDYDDSSWVVANKTNTTRPQQPLQGKYVLYGDEYGFHQGNRVWRGHFSGNATGLQLAVQTGFSGAMSAYLNGKFLSSVQGSSTTWSGVDIQEANYTFTPDMLRAENVLTVYHDTTGMRQDYNVNDEFKSPRGVRGYKLLSNNGNDFTKWTVSGNVGGENCPDTVRGCYNEGGWHYEKIGAHLPGFDDSHWKTGNSPLQGRASAGITAYRATFNLNFPANADVPLSLDFELDTTRYRSVVWVNGWQFGRYSASQGPQTSYPAPEGIFNHQGKNEILVTLWALDGPAKMKSLKLTKRAVINSSKASRLGLVQAGDWRALRGH